MSLSVTETEKKHTDFFDTSALRSGVTEVALASCENWFSREAARPVDSFEPAGTFWDDSELSSKTFPAGRCRWCKNLW